MGQKIHDFMSEVAAKNVGETEFLQAVEEVAEVIEFLCSERNTYTTGSVWSVKGSKG